MFESLFAKQIRRNIDIYVDDMVIKRLEDGRLLEDMEETLKTLWKVKMKLNLGKCTFRVEEGQCVG